jgi:hypothetical protein
MTSLGSTQILKSSTQMDALLTKYHALSAVPKRAVAAIVGAFVADAATRPAHWLYDRAQMEKEIGNKDPEFWHENLSQFYTLPTGRRSCYSDMAFAMLQALESPPHEFTTTSAEASLRQLFAPGSEYAEALARRKRAYELGHRMKDSIPGPWQHVVVTHFLETGKPEPNSKEPDGFCFALPLIAK